MALKLYVGCALTEAPPEFRDEVAELKALLKAQKNASGTPSFEVLEFLGLVEGTPEDVYRTDILEGIGSCDLMLAVCDYPSIGLGYEIAVMVEKRSIGKRMPPPVLAVAKEGKRVTRLMLGIYARYPHFTFEYYGNMLDDVPRLLDEKIESEMWDFGVGVPHGYPRGTAVGERD